MNRIYQKISSHFRVPTHGEKHDIMYSAKEVSIKRLTTTHGELFENKQLMHQLSRTQPLLPKPYAERAMLLYLAANLSQLSSRGIKSSSTNEESFGIDLYRESPGWSEFSQRTYELFVRELLSNLRDAKPGLRLSHEVFI
jgi:hypothetical protein